MSEDLSCRLTVRSYWDNARMQRLGAWLADYVCEVDSATGREEVERKTMRLSFRRWLQVKIAGRLSLGEHQSWQQKKKGCR